VYVVATPHEALPAPAHRPARDLIEAVLENMRQNLEPLKYSTLAPSRYLVYLHASEYARLEGIFGIIQQQTIRALNEELDRLNRGSRVERYAERLFKRPTAVIENAAADWHVQFLADADGDLKPGDVLVASELLLPESPELGAGGRTRRITTVHIGSRVTIREPLIFEGPVARPAERPADTPAHTSSAQTTSAQVPSGLTTSAQTTSSHARAVPSPVLARIAYEDDGGRHAYEVAKASVSVGRGGVAYPVDIRIVSSVDVSREHARVRHDAETGRFFLIDLSTLGTTLDGQPVPRGYDETRFRCPIARASAWPAWSSSTSRRSARDPSPVGPLRSAGGAGRPRGQHCGQHRGERRRPCGRQCVDRREAAPIAHVHRTRLPGRRRDRPRPPAGRQRGSVPR
jgi:hypothetical protein